MNDEMLRKLAEAIANQTLLRSWPFYLALAALSFIGTTLGAYLRARMAKRGEISATKADAREILEQLKRNTAASKSVEIALARGDWIEKERNTQKREKLEHLVISALAISAWLGRECHLATVPEPQSPCPSADEFYMLSTLYFPELSQECSQVHMGYLEAIQVLNQCRKEAFELKFQWDAAMRTENLQQLAVLLAAREELVRRHQLPLWEQYGVVYRRACLLALSAQRLMKELTDQHETT